MPPRPRRPTFSRTGKVSYVGREVRTDKATVSLADFRSKLIQQSRWLGNARKTKAALDQQLRQFELLERVLSMLEESAEAVARRFRIASNTVRRWRRGEIMNSK